MDDEPLKDESPAEDENKNAISSDLIRGHINTIILRTLYERDKYGYEIIEEIESKSHGQYTLKQPTLYSALKRLETQGYINAYWKTDEVSLGGRRKYYTLTDSGREIAEKNQAEWEYSRTVIDSLISDRSFDFSQPAPSAVDFKLLKRSTTRVPVVRDDEDESAEVAEETSDAQSDEEEFDDAAETAESAETCSPEEQAEDTEVAPQAEQPEEQTSYAAEEIASVEPEPVMDEEQRREVHENYLRLISQPVQEEVEEVAPYSETINTDKLLYNNKPETERDYKNIIDGLFANTLKRENAGSRPVPTENVNNINTVRIDDLGNKAAEDGLKINSNDYVITGTRKKTYNRGSSMLKSSFIVCIILLLEFTLSLIFKKDLGVAIAYPLVILALAVTQLLIFVVLYFTDLGKNTRKPSSTLYLSASIIVTLILIFIICIVAVLLKTNFSSAGDIMAKMIFPCIISLNIPTFTVCFYLFSRK